MLLSYKSQWSTWSWKWRFSWKMRKDSRCGSRVSEPNIPVTYVWHNSLGWNGKGKFYKGLYRCKPTAIWFISVHVTNQSRKADLSFTTAQLWPELTQVTLYMNCTTDDSGGWYSLTTRPSWLTALSIFTYLLTCSQKTCWYKQSKYHHNGALDELP